MRTTNTSLSVSQSRLHTLTKSTNFTAMSQHPYHQSKDKVSAVLPKYTLSLNDCLKLNNRNFQNYMASTATVAYSEEHLPFIINEDNPTINYAQLVSVVHLNEPYPNDSYKSFVYKNYNERNNILFNSDFESGNLRMAIKHADNEYDLVLRPETNSTRTFQWFYFSITVNNNVNAGSNSNSNTSCIKFNIINLIKKTILFNDNVRVLCHYNDAWSRNTNNVYYYANSIIIPQSETNNNNNNGNCSNSNTNNNNNGNNTNSKQPQNEQCDNIQYHTLTFTFDLSNLKDNATTVYFAYCYPYTFSNLTSYLSSLSNCFGNIIRFENIGHSRNGNVIHMLVITNFNDSFDDLAKKHAVVLTGRVHPGESNSSYVVQGLIEFLTSNNVIAIKLRKHFIFKIVPMLNPDGVIRGNFRMNTLGKDLNRMWVDAEPQTTPTIHYTKQMIQKTVNSRDIYLFCDFHGHSTKNNFFLYSCKSIPLCSSYSSSIINNNKGTFIDQVLPYLLHKENFYFDRNACVNKINPSKIKTARAVLKNEFKVDLSYCLESSMGSIKLANGTLIPFTIELYKNIGKEFCVALSKMINTKMFYAVLNFVRNEKREKKKNKESIKKNNSISSTNNNNNAVKEILPYIHSTTQSPRFNTVLIHNKKTQGLIQRSNSRNNVISSNLGNGYFNMKLYNVNNNGNINVINNNNNYNYNAINNNNNNNNNVVYKKYPLIEKNVYCFYTNK